MKFTSEQIDTLMKFVDENFPANDSPLPIDFDALQKNFNAEMKTFLSQCPFDDAEEAEVMEKLFLIGEFFQVFEVPGGKFFFNLFGERTAILGASGTGDDRFKILVCAYTQPETNEENILSSMILVGFVKVLLPAVDAEKFLHELSASGKKISGGVNFSISSEDKITFVMAGAHEEVSA